MTDHAHCGAGRDWLGRQSAPDLALHLYMAFGRERFERLRYVPHKLCLELKSLKLYTLAYRNLGIFQENVVNRMLRDVVKAAKPWAAELTGDFLPRGGVHTKVTAEYTRPRGKRKSASR